MLLVSDGFLQIDPDLGGLGEPSHLQFGDRVSVPALSVTSLPYTSLQSSALPVCDGLAANLPWVRKNVYSKSFVLWVEGRRPKVFNGTTWEFVRIHKFNGSRQVGTPMRVWNGTSWE